MVGRVYKCTRTLYSLGWDEDKEAARGRPADWSETSAGGERLERDIPKKTKGRSFLFFLACKWQNQTSGNCAPSLGTNLKLNVNKYFPNLQVHGL